MNRLRVCLLLLAVTVVVAARAEDTNALPGTITVDGITYSNVTWRSVTPATVSIFHRTGVASIPLEKLPPELQKKFGYDPAKAADWQKREAAADAVRRADLARQQAAASNAHGHEVLAFYYPWYGSNGRHWGGSNPAQHEILNATHYPVAGPYDSHDRGVIDSQIEMARTHGLTGFVSSWWGQKTFEDEAMPLLLDAAEKKGCHVSVYWETAPGKGTGQISQAISDLVYIANHYGTRKAFLKVDGKPVIFVYSRVVQQVPLDSWPAILSGARAKAADFILVADGCDDEHARVFDAVHVYNFAGALEHMKLADLPAWAGKNCAYAVNQARDRQAIACITVIPGYDDTKIRHSGFKVDRQNGEVYRALWQAALDANPDWVLITSWNEWHEGTEIEPSIEFGDTYLQLTKVYAARLR